MPKIIKFYRNKIFTCCSISTENVLKVNACNIYCVHSLPLFNSSLMCIYIYLLLSINLDCESQQSYGGICLFSDLIEISNKIIETKLFILIMKKIIDTTITVVGGKEKNNQ